MTHLPKTKKPSLVSILTDYLKSKRGIIVHSGDLEELAKHNPVKTYKGETAGVRLREMTCVGGKHRNPFVEKIENQDKTVSYRWIGPDPQKDPSHFRCAYCPKTAVTFLSSRAVCQFHSAQVSASLFS